MTFFFGWGVIFFSCQGLYKRECGCPEFRISHRFLHVSSLHSGLCPPPKRYQRDPKCFNHVIDDIYQVSHFSATILLLYSWMFLVYFPDFWCRRQQKSSPGIVTAGGREPVVVAQVAHVSRILMVSRSNFWVKRWFHQQEWWTNGISWGSAGISAGGDCTLQQPDMAGTSSILIHFVIFVVDDFPISMPIYCGDPNMAMFDYSMVASCFWEPSWTNWLWQEWRGDEDASGD